MCSTCRGVRRGPLPEPNTRRLGSASVIRQILSQPHLPELVRLKILEYVREKRAGRYGHRPLQVRRFVAALVRAGRQAGNVNDGT